MHVFWWIFWDLDHRRVRRTARASAESTRAEQRAGDPPAAVCGGRDLDRRIQYEERKAVLARDRAPPA
jgi:hypothetical protein